MVVLLDGSGKVMVGKTEDSETELAELEGGMTTELPEEEDDVGSGGTDEEESVGAGGASEEAEEDGGGVGIILEIIELRELIISPGSEEEGAALGGRLVGVSEGVAVGVSEVEGGLAMSLVTEATLLVRSLTTEPTALVRSPTTLVTPPRRPEDEEAGGGVIEAESDVEVDVPEEEAVSVMETGSKTLVVDDDAPGSTSETALLNPLATLDTTLITPPTIPPLPEDEGAGVTEELSVVEVDDEDEESVSVGVDDGDEALSLPPEPVGRPKAATALSTKSLTTCLFTPSRDFLACEFNGDE